MKTLWNRVGWPMLVKLGYGKSLLKQLLALIGAMQLVLILFSGAVISALVYRTERIAWQGRQGEAARYAADTMALFLRSSEDFLALLEQFSLDELAAQPDIAAKILEGAPAFMEVVYLDADGRVIANAPANQPVLANLFTIPQSNWFQAAAAGQRYLGKIQFTFQDEPYLIMAIPASNGGVAAARLHLHVLAEVVKNIPFGDHGSVYVVEPDGQVVAHTNLQAVLNGSSLAGRSEMAGMNQNPGSVWHGEYQNFQGQEVVGVTAAVPGANWVVFVEYPLAEAYQASRTAWLVVAAGLVVFGFLMTRAVALILRGAVLQPMRLLQQGASEIGQGNFTHRIQLERPEEIKQVAEAFNHMAAELQERDVQLAQKTDNLAAEIAERKRVELALYQAKDELEKRVEERTAELQAEIVERKRAEQQLLHDAFHDTLTGLPNRALLMDRLGRAVERAKRRHDYNYTVLFMDLDRFKTINDSLGHSVGDQVLQAFAQRLSDCLRPMDTVARIGGDEFVVLVEDIKSFKDATNVAERILELQKIPFSLGGHELYVTVSIGLVYSKPGYEQPEDALRDADIALYRAKGKGKARYEVFDPSLRDWALRRMELESDLRKALTAEELYLHYQPILSLDTNRLTGFEALLRWAHPRRGSIPPADFIPIAEETGLIIPIGEWVLRQACRQMAAWQQAYPTRPPLTINVNISGKQFTQPDLAEQIERLLQETGLPASSLKLEITESVFMENIDQADSILGKVKDLGVQFQIDDFGTGYSSLGYLHHFPITTIKIDRSFVSRLGNNGSKSEIVRTIVTLARDLGMEAVAEGVETEEQLAQLKAFGCGYGQGFLISRPVGQGAAEELLQRFLKG